MLYLLLLIYSISWKHMFIWLLETLAPEKKTSETWQLSFNFPHHTQTKVKSSLTGRPKLTNQIPHFRGTESSQLHGVWLGDVEVSIWSAHNRPVFLLADITGETKMADKLKVPCHLAYSNSTRYTCLFSCDIYRLTSFPKRGIVNDGYVEVCCDLGKNV